ncbi:hypothetical protein F4780DRAFT_784560 [Xylariomycetidae sp. FL0641]|nr:hypothetical protein F4780DRAFT_784560 [Xylariomycetidae sp. FL0641]
MASRESDITSFGTPARTRTTPVPTVIDDALSVTDSRVRSESEPPRQEPTVENLPPHPPNAEGNPTTSTPALPQPPPPTLPSHHIVIAHRTNLGPAPCRQPGQHDVGECWRCLCHRLQLPPRLPRNDATTEQLRRLWRYENAQQVHGQTDEQARWNAGYGVRHPEDIAWRTTHIYGPAGPGMTPEARRQLVAWREARWAAERTRDHAGQEARRAAQRRADDAAREEARRKKTAYLVNRARRMADELRARQQSHDAPA